MTDRQFPEWKEFYRTQPTETMPWYYPTLDPDVERALARHQLQGRALDLGTGPGTQAIALAQRGFDVTATDISPEAVEGTSARAEAAGLHLRCVVDDITQSHLTDRFNLVLDRGCFHVLAPSLRAGYVQTLTRLLEPSGFLLLKCFSHEQPGDVGPYRFTADEIEDLFRPTFTPIAIESSIYHGTFEPAPRALFCQLQRKPE